MTAMNRLYDSYRQDCLSAHLDKYELGFDFAYSSIDKHKREHCVIDITLQP